jgi:hypothetical protein
LYLFYKPEIASRTTWSATTCQNRCPGAPRARSLLRQREPLRRGTHPDHDLSNQFSVSRLCPLRRLPSPSPSPLLARAVARALLMWAAGAPGRWCWVAAS